LERKTIFVAAASIQTSWRRMKHKSVYTGLLVAAISVQAMYRGGTVRNKIRTRHAAARVIQMKWLSHSWGLLQRESATKIQSIWRSFVKRNAFKITAQAAIIVQKTWRRADARYLFQKSIFAVTILQCAWRKHSAQLNYHLDLLEIVQVQSVVRRRQAMREASSRKIAVHAIQMATRRIQANHRLKELKYQKVERETQLRSVVICQVSVKRIHLFFLTLASLTPIIHLLQYFRLLLGATWLKKFTKSQRNLLSRFRHIGGSQQNMVSTGQRKWDLPFFRLKLVDGLSGVNWLIKEKRQP
jgi:hypothetical protein